MKEACHLWSKTRDLAKDYGESMSERCPLDAVCQRKACAMIAPIKNLAAQEPINTEGRLVALREELKKFL